jgi:PAS domain S-box-containing protein
VVASQESGAGRRAGIAIAIGVVALGAIGLATWQLELTWWRRLAPGALVLRPAAALALGLAAIVVSGVVIALLAIGKARLQSAADAQAEADGSERRRTELLLRESQERLRMAQQAAGIGAFEWNLVTGTRSWTAEFEAMHGLRPGAYAQTREAWERVVHPDDVGVLATGTQRAIETGDVVEGDWRVVWPDGTTHWIAGRWKAFADEAGRPDRVCGVTVDITERKRAERDREQLLVELGTLNAELEDRVERRTAQLRATVAEREALLQEVHHRVKNNLQVISSLLNMQIRRLAPGANRSGLVESMTRVEAIALIHERLYQASDYARVPFSEYASTLARNIVQATGTAPEAVALHVEIDPVELSVDRAIPCGLILNELITNALKHAFPPGRTGTLRIALQRASPSELVLAVSDDGVGMARERQASRPRTLGLQLVGTLVDQLRGRLELVHADGLAVRIAFPVEPPRDDLESSQDLAAAAVRAR